MKRKLLALTLIVFFVGGIVGCAYNASLVNTTHDMLSVSKNSYETTGMVVTDLYGQGRISEEQKKEIIDIARPYSVAHNELVETLATYEESKDASEVGKIEIMVKRVSEALGTFLDEIQKYLVKEDK